MYLICLSIYLSIYEQPRERLIQVEMISCENDVLDVDLVH